MATKPEYKPFPFEVLAQGGGDSQAYTGHCHCGRIKYKVTLSPPFPAHKVVSCNCSICIRNGYLLVYPLRENVEMLRGDDVGKYKFNRGKATHVFCPKCGGSVYIDFNGAEAKDVLGINVRTLEGVDVDGLSLLYCNGAAHPGEYKVD